MPDRNWGCDTRYGPARVFGRQIPKRSRESQQQRHRTCSSLNRARAHRFSYNFFPKSLENPNFTNLIYRSQSSAINLTKGT
ncbi:hypothetical protein MKX01_026032 [Papaver californicum]|nr:hypothetical protein MKX01_026032 [Papaver californicum]